MSVGRAGQTATMLADGRILLAGGTGNDPLAGVLDTAEIYDSRTNRWSVAPPLTTARSMHTASLLGNGSVLAVGGFDAGLLPAATAEAVTIQYEQSINFDPLPNRTVAESPFPLQAFASSGLPVSFTAMGSCSLSGVLVTFVQTGICAVTATQAGNYLWLPAPSVVRSFTIYPTKADPGWILATAPMIANIGPNSGPVAGGQSDVVISGSNLIGAASVTFGGVAAVITNNTDTVIRVTTAPHAA